MNDTIEARLRRIEDIQSIHSVLNLYCRAVDRLDVELLKSVYHPDATDAHGTFDGDAHAFAEFCIEILGKNSYTSHLLSNTEIELDGDVAHVESHYTAHTRVPGGWDSVARYFGEGYAQRVRDLDKLGLEQEHLCGGRYIDRFERRDGVWRIAARSITNEWNQCRPSIELWEGRLEAMRLPSRRDKQDLVYTFGPTRAIVGA